MVRGEEDGGHLRDLGFTLNEGSVEGAIGCRPYAIGGGGRDRLSATGGTMVYWPWGAGVPSRMRREDLAKHISIDPKVCFGRPVIRGTRIWVTLIVDNLAEGVSEEELLRAYPQLTRDDIRAALGFAAEMTRERVLPVAAETGA